LRLVGLVVALLLLAASACVPPPAIPHGQLRDWSSVEVGRVRLFGDIAPEEIQRFADDLALFDASFAHLSGWAPAAKTVPVTVFLIRDPKLARRFGLGRGIAGWAHLTLDAIFSAVQVRTDYTETRSTLFHEYTHMLLRRGRRAPLPPWYDEGVASFFQTVDARDDVVLVGTPPSAAVARVSARGPLPLDELFEGFRGKRKWQYIADFYATSWAFSHYLLLTPNGRSEMSRMVEALSNGDSPEQAQRLAFDRSQAELESELLGHIGHLARGVPSEVILELAKLDIQAAGRAAPLPFADAAGELGQMASQRARDHGDAGDRALAVRLFEMAASEQPLSPGIGAAFAEALALTGRTWDASAALQTALAQAPNDARVQVLAGRVELARAEANEDETTSTALAAAESHFMRSLELDPDSASAWFGLGRTLQQAARHDEAMSALRTARGLSWSSRLDLVLGELELEAGQSQQAFELLWPLVQDAHGGPTSEEASQLLEDASLLPDDEDAD
jgi:tetratricopeptide (TPR) repeat protein